MASSSVSSVQKSFKFDVFLSFRGEDTRKTFVDHLYHALHQRGIITYKDDEKIKKGERIDNQLITSIEDSRFYIIVFSKKYASSSWCLDELVKIMECQKMTEHTAYPIFYDVEPTEIRNQSGAVGKAFAKHEKKEGAGRWRDALKDAAGLAGRELKTTVDGHESKFIQLIVQDISSDLRSINWSADGKLVGMETRVKAILSSLETRIDDVLMIGIKGIGGGGKTTLARAVFDLISISFEGKSFVENVREVSKGSSGLKKLKKQVLKDVLNEKSVDVGNMKKVIGIRKVLIILDDVDDIEQLQALAGEHNWFKPGSRIIITTRDEQVLVAHGVNFIHDVSLLSDEEAIRLFSRYAFRREILDEAYAELSRKVVRYADGLPLTIQVLGSHLCGKSESEWADAIERLKTIPLEETLKRLEISYDGLEKDHKEIFLHVACMLKHEQEDTAIRMLESCGYHAKLGLKVLVQKSLMNISDYGWLDLHDHIEEMGRNIARCLQPQVRLWITEEIDDILVNDQGTEATRSIILRNSSLDPTIIMKGLRKMKELRFFYVLDKTRNVVTNQVDQYLPNTLQCIRWDSYPFCCLPKTFQANNLVYLEMRGSNIFELWEGGERKVLNKLKFLDLSYSDLRTFDLEMTPNLQWLALDSCYNFIELHMPVECSKLNVLNLRRSKVSNLNLGISPYLEKLDLEGCSDFVELDMPVECSKLNVLILCGSKVSNLDLGMTPYLEKLDLRGCSDFVELHMPVECSMLKFLYLSESMVSNLNLGMTPYLETLFLYGCSDFVELHMPVECSKLNVLNLGGSKVSNLNLGMTPYLERLYLEKCSDFVELHMPVECSKLIVLKLGGSKVSNLNLGMAPYLEKLDLRGCSDFVKLHMPVECSRLNVLNLGGSKVSNLNLGMTPYLKKLNLEGCGDFVELHIPVECPKLNFLNLGGSKVSNLNLGMTPYLETLYLNGCSVFVELHMPVECSKLNFLCLSGSKVSNLNLGMTPYLKRLYLEKCSDFVELHMPVECPKLNFLNLTGSKVSNLNLGMAPNLKTLYLSECHYLQNIQAPVGFLENLANLKLNGCSRFKRSF